MGLLNSKMDSGSTSPLNVEIDAGAWAELGRLPGDVFRRVQHGMDALVRASSPELLAKARASPGLPLTLNLGDTLVRCEVDARRRVVTVLGVELSPESEPR